ncbi:Pleiotropic drug resistance ABC transporter protein [Mycena venus]|uniref:Pleiotropic drug resistance ABC transporter protein n=1 Tax=Mycena venus TaxID=2733690 RepID=A0A8H6XKE3_9AGAR|nr:Pleiotropic drug resistance ABC transporter protein [Mycena venus]
MPANSSTTVATQRGSQFLPNATGFEIGGGQFILGDVHNHNTSPGPLPSNSTSLDTLDEAFSESEIYCRQMLRQKRGLPLYEPAPQRNLPTEYQRQGISIGDVGSVTSEGIFDFFFNIFLPAEHPINGNRTPEGFSPMPTYESVDLSHIDYDLGSHVSTSTVQRLDLDGPSDEFPGGDFVFHCNGPQGAILSLPYGSHLRNLRNVEDVRAYVTKHAVTWYKYINGPRGRGLANGELYLVTGHEKVRSWGMASYYANHQEFVLAFKPTVRNDANQYRWSGNPGQKNPSRRKSYDRPRTNGDPLNHTTFVHGLSISLGTGLWSRLVGTVPVETSSIADFQSRLNMTGGSYAAGSQGSSYWWSWSLFGAGSAIGGKRSAQQSGGVVLSHISPNPKVCNPGTLINEYIQHKVPNATIIMSHDDDWSDILGDPSEIASPAEFVQQVDDQFAIAEQDGATFLVLKSPPTSPLTDNVATISTWDNIPGPSSFSGSGTHMMALMTTNSQGPRSGTILIGKEQEIKREEQEIKKWTSDRDNKLRDQILIAGRSLAGVAANIPQVMRGRGRPKGSKNKRAVPTAAGEASSSAPPRKRGRPPKEKKDDDDKDAEDDGDGDEEPTPKRKRSRPPRPARPADPKATPEKEGVGHPRNPWKVPQARRLDLRNILFFAKVSGLAWKF